MILVIRIEPKHPDTGVPSNVWLTDAPAYGSTDGTPFQAFPFLKRGVSFKQQLFSDNAVIGNASTGYGKITAVNVSGDLDYLENYIFDGTRAYFYFLDHAGQELPANPGFICAVTHAEFGLDEVVVHLSSIRYELTEPLQKFSFTAEPITDLEGDFDGAEEARGSTMPMLLGRCFGIRPACINRLSLAYACNYVNGVRAPITNITGVYNKGGRYDFDANYANLAALVAATVPDGHYSSCLAEGVIRLGSVPTGEVTMDAEVSTDSVFTLVMFRIGWVDDVDYNYAESLSVVDNSFRGQGGYYVTGSETAFDIITHDLGSLGAWGLPDVTGMYRFGRLLYAGYDPNPSFAFDENTSKRGSIKKILPPVPKGIPIKGIRLHHTKVWAHSDRSSLFESVDPSEAEFRSTEYRQTVFTDDTNIHPFAEYIDLFTDLNYRPRLIIHDPSFYSYPVGLWEHVEAYVDPSGPLVVDYGGTSTYDFAVSGSVLEDYFVTVNYTPNPFPNPAALAVTIDWTASSQTHTFDEGTTSEEFSLAGVVPRFVRISNYLITPGESVYVYSIRLEQRYHPDDDTPLEYWTKYLQLFSSAQSCYELRTTRDVGEIYQVGNETTLKLPRYGLDDGKKFQIIAREIDWINDDIRFIVWRSEGAPYVS